MNRAARLVITAVITGLLAAYGLALVLAGDECVPVGPTVCDETP